VPAPRGETIRQGLLAALAAGPRTARELSEALQVREREVLEHLAHLARSLRRGGRRLAVEPARCLACGFVFRQRERFARPSACPRCRSQHLRAPVFGLAERR